MFPHEILQHITVAGDHPSTYLAMIHTCKGLALEQDIAMQLMTRKCHKTNNWKLPNGMLHFNGRDPTIETCRPISRKQRLVKDEYTANSMAVALSNDYVYAAWYYMGQLHSYDGRPSRVFEDGSHEWHNHGRYIEDVNWNFAIPSGVYTDGKIYTRYCNGNYYASITI